MRRMLFVAGSVVLACAVATGTMASTTGYDLSWHVLASGGGQSASPGYTLSGTMGQAQAGVLAGDAFTLGAGFWGGGMGSPALEHPVWLPLVLRSR